MRWRLPFPWWSCAALVVSIAASTARAGDDAAPRPAQVTQVWPQHMNGAALPAADAKDTDPYHPKGGWMWRWTVVPPRSGPRGDPGRICAIGMLPRAKAGETWVDDADVYVAGELGVAQMTRDGRDFWTSDTARATWWSDGCGRPLPDGGFTFDVTLTRKEMEKAEIRPVRFRLTDGERDAPPASASAVVATVETWTDLLGAARSVPLTAPVTRVGLEPLAEPLCAAPASVGLRGLVVVRGARAVVNVRHAAAAGKRLVVYTSLERDLEDDDPSPSGLRATSAPMPPARRISVTASGSALDGAGKATLVVVVPDEKAVVGLSFYVQAGVGNEAAEGLSCALRVTVVDSLTDYDGDGQANARDPDPLDPSR